jgi:hypothetical protein
LSTYRLARRLGTLTGLTESFAGTHVGPERPVMLKRVPAPWGTRGLADRLVPLQAKLAAAGLPGPLEVGVAGDAPWLVTELVEGETLRHVLASLAKASHAVAPNEGLALVARVAALLAPVHAQELAHGDVCASTILLAPDGAVRLLEGGVATAAGTHPELGPARAEPNALAPEQLQGSAGPAADVFHLGLVLFELSMGRPLWGGLSPAAAALQCAAWPGLTRDRVKQVPEPWLTLLLSMLAVSPAARPPMTEVAAVLEQGLQQAGWDGSPAALARLVARACPGRTPHGAGLSAAGQELVLAPVTPPQGRPAVTPPGAVVARIATRKMTREELAAQVGEPRPSPQATAPAAGAIPPGAGDARDVRLGELLVERGALSRQQLVAGHEQVARFGGSLASALLALDFIDEDTAVTATAEVTRSPSVTGARLAQLMPSPEALALVPLELSRRVDAVPLALKGGTQLVVAMGEPLDAAALDALKAAVAPKSVVALRAGERALFATRERFYRAASGSSGVAAAPAAEGGGGGAWAFELEAPGGPSAAPPGQAPAASSGSGFHRVELATRLLDTMLGLQGTRGTQARELIALAAGLASRGGVSAKEEARVRLAAQALCVTALAQNHAPFAVPSLADFQDTVGFDSDVEALVQPVLDWPEALPTEAAARALVLAFAFAQHAGDPRPAPARAAAAVALFKGRFKLPDDAAALLLDELSGR